MTTEDLETFIIRLQPKLEKKVVTYDNGFVYFQEALLDMFRHINELDIKTDKEFTDTVMTYFNRMKFRRWNQEMSREMVRRELIAKHNDTGIEEYPFTNLDLPFSNTRVEALEYIELITNQRAKQIVYKYYIEGKTLTEIGAEHSIGKSQVDNLRKQGIEEIKQAVVSM